MQHKFSVEEKYNINLHLQLYGLLKQCLLRRRVRAPLFSSLLVDPGDVGVDGGQSLLKTLTIKRKDMVSCTVTYIEHQKSHMLDKRACIT